MISWHHLFKMNKINIIHSCVLFYCGYQRTTINNYPLTLTVIVFGRGARCSHHSISRVQVFYFFYHFVLCVKSSCILWVGLIGRLLSHWWQAAITGRSNDTTELLPHSPHSWQLASLTSLVLTLLLLTHLACTHLTTRHTPSLYLHHCPSQT